MKLGIALPHYDISFPDQQPATFDRIAKPPQGIIIPRSILFRAVGEINARDNVGCTPLHAALWMPSLNAQRTARNVEALLAAGADRDATDRQDRTSRALAEESGVAEVIAAMKGTGS